MIMRDSFPLGHAASAWTVGPVSQPADQPTNHPTAQSANQSQLNKFISNPSNSTLHKTISQQPCNYQQPANQSNPPTDHSLRVPLPPVGNSVFWVVFEPLHVFDVAWRGEVGAAGATPLATSIAPHPSWSGAVLAPLVEGGLVGGGGLRLKPHPLAQWH